MNNDSSRLIDDNQSIIFKDNVERQRFRNEFNGWWLRQVNFDFIICPQFVTRFHSPVIDQYISVFNSALNARAADVCKLSRKESIEACAGYVCRCCDELSFQNRISSMVNPYDFCPLFHRRGAENIEAAQRGSNSLYQLFLPVIANFT